MNADETPPSERRLVENEQLMESLNERLEKHLRDIKPAGDFDRTPISFFCECSDLRCRGRIEMSPERYHEIHRDPAVFVVVRGHERPGVESVVDTWGGTLIVRKHGL